jgi:hypothetical protein
MCNNGRVDKPELERPLTSVLLANPKAADEEYLRQKPGSLPMHRDE